MMGALKVSQESRLDKKNNCSVCALRSEAITNMRLC